MKTRGIFFLILSLFLLSNSLFGKILYVADNGNNTDGLTWETAFRTIQTAVNAASAEMGAVTILVGSAGTGHGTGVYNENLIISPALSAILTIESESGPLQTTIQANSGAAHAVSIMGSYVTLRGFSICKTNSTAAAVALVNASNCTIENNRCGWDSQNRNGRGIYLNNASNNIIQNNTCSSNIGAGISISASSGNLLLGNTLQANGGAAIELINSNQNTIQQNHCTAHQNSAAISLSASLYNVVTQNFCSGNYTGLALLSGGALYNSITENLFENSTNYGIQLQSNSNQLLRNTVRQNYYGFYCFESQHNLLSNNLFQANTTSFVYYRVSEGDYWNSPIPFTYRYADAIFSSKMGNYYSSYSGTDLNNNGIGETPYSLYGTFSQDYFPLTELPTNYLLQTWYLKGGAAMSMEPNSPGQWQTIPAGSSLLWLSETSALGPINFNVLSAQDGWSGQILFSTAVNGSAFAIEIGYADPADGLFISGGTSAVLSGTKNLFQFKTSPQSFTLPAGKALAVRITNNSVSPRSIFTGGGWTCITPPAGTSEVWPGTPPPPPNPGDLNQDGWVNIQDFAYLSTRWEMEGCTDLNNYCDFADINKSGKVDLADIQLLAVFWLMGPDDLLAGDWNEDFKVNMDDIALLSSQWTGDLNQLIELRENWLKGAF
ncbi:MAG TPA: right-handed parallel beta-helix repeat-containing protein [Anaerohalosphaeraceae bacterium]|nr:right-handed parallel beta-helix repeat-containing protein [Anaerohalosphaeraceae bacterium]HPP55799.1 right-handed parallel beta-helix repeat-containing protein [Anaerohalosphaeraceae bacterium]